MKWHIKLDENKKLIIVGSTFLFNLLLVLILWWTKANTALGPVYFLFFVPLVVLFVATWIMSYHFIYKRLKIDLSTDERKNNYLKKLGTRAIVFGGVGLILFILPFFLITPGLYFKSLFMRCFICFIALNLILLSIVTAENYVNLK